MWLIHTMEYYPAFKKERNSVMCYNMDEPRGYLLSEISQKDKYCIQAETTITETGSIMVITRGCGGGGIGIWEAIT